MLPGYQVMDEGFGYYFDGDDGIRRKMMGGTPRDQVFAKESLGQVNVSMAWELLDRTSSPNSSSRSIKASKTALLWLKSAPNGYAKFHPPL